MTQGVLVIDDSEDVHRVLGVRLASEDLTLTYSLSARAGIELAKTTRPDLILLDLRIPDMHGFDVCRVLKENPLTAPIPVIFLTGDDDTRTKVEGFAIGAVDYITKPFEPAELRARVRNALRTKLYHDMLAERAHVDALTGLDNRARFDTRLDGEMAAVARYGRTVSLLMIDLDHFKSINDRFGHPFGDRVLRAASEALASTIRRVDGAYRYGGEEFAVILPETNIGGALDVAERIRSRIEALELEFERVGVRLTASIGAASTERSSNQSSQELLYAADVALLGAKRAGRNRVHEDGASLDRGADPSQPRSGTSA